MQDTLATKPTKHNCRSLVETAKHEHNGNRRQSPKRRGYTTLQFTISLRSSSNTSSQSERITPSVAPSPSWRPPPPSSAPGRRDTARTWFVPSFSVSHNVEVRPARFKKECSYNQSPIVFLGGCGYFACQVQPSDVLLAPLCGHGYSISPFRFSCMRTKKYALQQCEA